MKLILPEQQQQQQHQRVSSPLILTSLPSPQQRSLLRRIFHINPATKLLSIQQLND